MNGGTERNLGSTPDHTDPNSNHNGRKSQNPGTAYYLRRKRREQQPLQVLAEIQALAAQGSDEVTMGKIEVRGRHIGSDGPTL